MIPEGAIRKYSAMRYTHTSFTSIAAASDRSQQHADTYSGQRADTDDDQQFDAVAQRPLQREARFHRPEEDGHERGQAEREPLRAGQRCEERQDRHERAEHE